MLSSVCLTELILNNVFKQTFAGFSNGTKAKVYWLFVIVIFILESYIVPLPKG
jgi:hypothetical protein